MEQRARSGGAVALAVAGVECAACYLSTIGWYKLSSE